MAGRRAGAGLALAAVALSAAGCGTKTVTVTTTRTRTVTTTRTVTQPADSVDACTGSQLSGRFWLARGSGSAGQIAYYLSVQNTAQTSCFVSGLPHIQLRSASGAALPTNVVAAQPHVAGKLVVVEPGMAGAIATARFSPSVPGTGDSQSGPCQPKATTLDFTPNGGGTISLPIQPPTSVCEQGTLSFSFFGAA